MALSTSIRPYHRGPVSMSCAISRFPTLICLVFSDHLYFDRVHPFVPFLNRNRYFRQCRRTIDDGSPSIRALRHAMWTLAACFSTQFQHIQKPLYAETKVILDQLDLNMSVESTGIMELQARTLLVVYEVMCMDLRTSWISAGNCMRLALHQGLHEIDGSNQSPSAADDDNARKGPIAWTEIEEQRRLFWVIFSIDCFMNLINEAPFKTDEDTVNWHCGNMSTGRQMLTFLLLQILTRLPAPEVNFQNEQPATSFYISEVLSDKEKPTDSSFVEVIVTLAVSGRCLLHQRRSLAESVHQTSATAFWCRHKATNVALSKSKLHITAKACSDVMQADPLSLLSDMMRNALVLTMHKLLNSINLDRKQHQTAIAEYEQKALDAMKELITLSGLIPSFSYFKVTNSKHTSWSA